MTPIDQSVVGMELDDPGGPAPTDVSHQPEPMNIDKDDASRLQKVNKLAQYVPYGDKLSTARTTLWHNLKQHFCTAIVAQGQPLQDWLYACEQYFNAFDFAITKEEHITLIRVCLKALVKMEHDFATMRKLTKFLSRLLKRPELLSRTDLELNWRDFYKLLDRIHFSQDVIKQTVLFEPEFSSEVKELIVCARVYFPAKATSEMLSEWRQYICIYSNKYSKYLGLFKTFLPTLLSPEEHAQGHQLWFDDFLGLWSALPNQFELSSCYMQLFANIAKNAIGYIDWEPHQVLLFDRFKRSFNGILMIGNEMGILSQWIVYMIYPGSSTLAHLKRLCKFKMAEPKKIHSALMDEFIKRLRVERYQKKKHWYDFTPDSHKLTDEIIAEFGAFIFKQFRRLNFTDFDVDYIHKLSLFCSELMPKEVMPKLKLAQERYFEPNRLQSALQLFSISAYHMLTNEKVGPKFRTEIIPTLNTLLGSINTTDHNLCYLNLLAIRSVVILGMPMEDCSRYSISKKSQLQKPQVKLLQQSALNEDFASRFLDCCFKIIDSNNEDLFNYSKKGLTMKTLLSDILTHILVNVSDDKVKNIVNRLYSHMTNHIYESVTCCNILHQLIAATVTMDQTGYAQGKFLRGIMKRIDEIIEDKPKFSDIIKSEFVYFLTLFVSTLREGKSLLAYRDQLVDMFKKLLAIDYQENSPEINLVTSTLSWLFAYLTTTYTLKQEFNPKLSPEFSSNPDYRFDQFLNWPYEVEIKDLHTQWHIPSVEEIDFARQLYMEFIKPQMRSLEQYSSSQVNLSKAELERTLHILLCFCGLRDCLPKFTDPSPPQPELYFTMEDPFTLDFFEGDHFRDDLISLMPKVLDRLRSSPSDNVQALKLIIKIVDYTVFPADAVNGSAGATTAQNDMSMLDETFGEDILMASEALAGGKQKVTSTNFYSTYVTLDKKKTFIPPIHHSKISDYHLHMLSSLKCWSNAQYTVKHQQAIDQLLDLSTCSCTEVRTEAQAILLDIIESYPRAFYTIVPKLAENLTKAQENYDAFKGTLYLLIGTTTKSLLLSDNWDSVLQLWPKLVETNFVEKPKIVDLLDNDLIPLFSEFYFTIPIAKNLLSPHFSELFKSAGALGFVIPSTETIQRAESEIISTNQQNLHSYETLVQKLISTLEAGDKHWRFYNFGFHLLNFLIRYDYTFPRQAVELFLDNLVHDSVQTRRSAVAGLKKILYLLKPKKETRQFEVDNSKFAQLDMDCFKSAEEYNQTTFYDKAHFGFYPTGPHTTTVHVPIDQAKLVEYQFIKDRFMNEDYLNKIFELYSVEKEKNAKLENLFEVLEQYKDFIQIESYGLGMISSIDTNLVKVWQYLFQLFGLFNSELIFPRIYSLLDENKPNPVKLAVEIIAGMMKASIVFNYDQFMIMREFILDVLNKYLFKAHTDTKNMWNYLFNSVFVNRDMRRFMWVFKFLFSEQLFTESMTSANQAGDLAFLSNVMMDNWKYPQVSSGVLTKLEANLDFHYNNVRKAISSTLNTSIFFPRIGLAYDAGTNPSKSEFIARIRDRLHRTLSPLSVQQSDVTDDHNLAHIKSTILDKNTDDGQRFNNFVETVTTFMLSSLLQKNLCDVQPFVEIFSYLTLVQNKNNKQAQQTVNQLLSGIGTLTFKPQHVDFIIDNLEKISKNWNWHTRKEASYFIYNFTFSSFFILKRQDDENLLNRILTIVLRLLEDEVVEVRESATKTLSGLIAWPVFERPRHVQLIAQLKAKCADPSTTPAARHGAILGLCAYVEAHPIRLPKFLTDVIIFLCAYLHEPPPIQKSVNETLKSFMKTHQSNWVEYETKFNAEQLEILSESPIFSSYIS